eukprot:10011327-Ditylum_brightwellii.AAC.1
MEGGDKNKQTEVATIMRCPHKDSRRAAGAEKQPKTHNFHTSHQPHHPQQPQQQSLTTSSLHF